MFDLRGRVAFVTGSSKGLGRAMAMTLSELGAKVALNYANNQQAAERTFQEFRDRGGEGILLRGDATSEHDIRRMIGEIESALGSVDILIVNATCDQPELPVEQYDWALCQKMLDFFVKSPFLLTQAVVPKMKERRWGRIINIGSEVFQRGMPNFSAYVAAKGGQNGLTRSLASELAPWGITVNMVSPGWIPVERHDQAPPEVKESYLRTIPAGRWGVPEDVASAIAFLSSSEAAFVNGQNLCVNGGVTVA